MVLSGQSAVMTQFVVITANHFAKQALLISVENLGFRIWGTHLAPEVRASLEL